MASPDLDPEVMDCSDEEDPRDRGSPDLHQEGPWDRGSSDLHEDPGNHRAMARVPRHYSGNQSSIARSTDRGRYSGDHLAIPAPRSQPFVLNPQRGGSDSAIIVSNSKNVNISTGQTVPGTVGEDTVKLLLIEAKRTFVETDIYRQVKRKLKTFGYVTICGASGEGKTTMALILSSNYRNRGYQVVFVDNIDKFDLDSCLSSTTRVFLIIDDIFGTVSLSSNVLQIKSFLKNLLLHLEQCKRTLKQIQSVRPDESKHKQDYERKGQRKDIRVIFTTKSYNFHDGFAQLYSGCFPLFEEQKVMNMTLHSLSTAEEKEIYERHKSQADGCSQGILPKYRDLEIPSKLFGFPLICKLCTFSGNPTKLFKEPLSYLREELTVIIAAKNDRSAVLVLMLLCEGRLQLTKLERDDADQELDEKVNSVISLMPTATRSGMCQAARSFRGTFFTRGDTVGFAHSSIYDACAFVVYGINPSFVLTHCSDAFLYERVQPETVRETKVDENLNLISVSEEYYDLLSTRFANAIKQGKFSKSVTHPILKHRKLLEQLFDTLTFDATKHKTNDPLDNLWIHQREKGKSFLYWAVLGHNPHLVTNAETRTGEVFTEDEIREAMGGCAQTNKASLLQWLLAKSDGHDQTDTLNRLLLTAAEHGSTETLLYLLNAGASIHSSDSGKQNIFHLLCKSRHENTLEALLNAQIPKHVLDSVDVNGCTPLLVAAKTGSLGCFRQLVSSSNKDVQDMDGNGVLHLACHGRNMVMVEYLVSDSNINMRGKDGWTPIMAAAFSGYKSVCDLLEEKGADLSLLDTFGDSLLHLACLGGNISIAQHLVSDSKINLRGVNRWTPIMCAALCGHKSVFDLLEAKGTDLSMLDTFGDSLLHLACQGGNMSIVQHLVSHSNINLRGKNRRTPIMAAAFSGRKVVFDLLEAKGADLSLFDTFGDSLLHMACQGGNIMMVQHLVSDSNINLRGKDGRTPIMAAAFSGHKSVFDLLEEKGADLSLLDTFGDSLLHHACLGGISTIVQHLVSDSNIGMKGKYGRTPIMSAAFKGHKSVFDLLEEKGADLSLLDTFSDSLLHLACLGGNVVMVQQLLSDSNINLRGEGGWTPIMAAAFIGQKSVFDLLEEKGADLALNDTFGDSLLHLACQGGNMVIVQHLLSDSNINLRGKDGCTPIIAAAFSGYKSVFDLLEVKGADLSILDTFGDSLLHHACLGGISTIVQHLVSDSNIDMKGKNGRTPIMSAAFKGHKSVFDLLEEKGADLSLLDTFGDSLLHLACLGGNVVMVQHLLSESNINFRGKDGWTPIMAAAFRGHKSVFDLLEAKGADLSMLDTFGDSLLHLACLGGNVVMVEYLVSDSNINVRGKDGWTPIMAAAFRGHKSVFDLLEEKGADLSLLDRIGDSLLHLACLGGNFVLVQHLLSDSNINLRGTDGWTPIMAAALSGYKSVFDLLEAKGADLSLLDTFGDSLLHLACLGGNMVMVQHLVSDSNINVRGKDGLTPIMAAAFSGYKSVFDLLEANGTDLSLLDTFGDSLLHLACQGGNMVMVQHLVSDSNINVRGKDGRTPIMGAAFRGHKSVFDLLEAKGADQSLLDTFGDSLFHLACQGGNMVMVQHLLSDSNINLRGKDGWTPIMAATFRGHKSVFDLLEAKGADLSLFDTFGDGLFHLACQGGNMVMVQHLLSDSNINLRGKNGRTPIMAAAFRGHKSVFDLLEAKGADLSLLDTFGDSLLHLACLGGIVVMVQHLVSDWKINVRGRNGRTPIMFAAVLGYKSVFDLLEEMGADLSLLDTFGDSLLHYACLGGNVVMVQHLVSDSNINVRGKNGRTPIMSAAVLGYKSVFDLLEEKGADLSLLDTFGDSLLHLACRGGNVVMVQHLLSDSNINLRGKEGWTPIMAAAFTGHTSVFDLLEAKGADLSLFDTFGDRVLHHAGQGGNMVIVQHLVSDSNINVRGKNGKTPIMTAAFRGHKSVFDLLEAKGADLSLFDTFGDGLFHLACQGGNMVMVQHLLSDSNINLRGKDGKTPIMAAAFRGHKSVFDLLEAKGADLSLFDTFGDGLFHLACQGGNIVIVQHLVSDANISMRGKNGWTPIMTAAFSGYKSVFDILQGKGADLSLFDTFGDSSLHLACLGGNMVMVQHLLSDSNINLRGKDGRTPIMAAAFSGYKSVFDLLEAKGADLSLFDTFGDGLFHLACQGGNMVMVQHLLSDSNINLRGKDGKTPIMAAAFSGHKSVFDLLEAKGADPSLFDTFGDGLFHLACQGGNIVIVQHLVSDANISMRGKNGRTPIMAAAFSGYKSVFDLLEAKEADLSLFDAFGDGLFHLACQGGNMVMVQHLLSNSNINLRGKDGWTPIMAAAFRGHKSVFDLLEAKGADLSMFDTFGDGVFHLACQGGNMGIVQHLVSDANISMRGKHGWTPIMAAAFSGHKSVFDVLEAKGADLSLFDTFGDGLFHLACQGGNIVIVQHLVSDANISMRGKNGRTPIMASAFSGYKSVFDLLEAKGADLSLLDTFGDSLLHLACLGGNVVIVQHLLSDSNINLRGKDGWTPIMAASFRGHKSVFDLLVSKGADLSLFDTYIW